MQVPIRNMAGETVGELDLRDDVFAIEPNVAVMHQAVVRQLANARLGTHSTKTRAEVRGGGRKPWRQKGTGRARHGSIRSPLWAGGGIAHGPKPRSYAQKMNRKMRQLALRSALSVKVRDNQVVVVDSLAMPAPKTREMLSLLENLELSTTTLIVLPESNENLERSAHNLPYVKTLRASCLNVRDLLSYDHVVMPAGAVEIIHNWLGAEARGAAA